MKPVWIILAVCIGWVGLQAVLRSSSSGGGGASGWDKALTKALADGQKQNKPVVLYFTADWCPPCQEMKKTTWPDPAVKNLLNTLIFVEVDHDRSKEAVKEFDVEVLPTLLRLNSDGEVASTLTGEVSADEFVEWITGKPARPVLPVGPVDIGEHATDEDDE